MFDPFGDNLGRQPETDPEVAPEPVASEPTGPAPEPTGPAAPDPFAPPRYEPAPQPPSPYGDGGFGRPAPSEPETPTWARYDEPVYATAPNPPVPPSPPPGGHGGSGEQPPRRRSPWLVALVALSLVMSGFAIARASGHTTKIIESGANATTATVSTRPTVVSTSKGSTEPVAAVAANLAPSVVQIETSQGLGSGFVYDTEGHVLTAAHVLEGAGATVTIRLADGTSRKGTVVGADQSTDIGVVKVDVSGTSATPASLALNDPLQVGQTAVAIGSPFGLEQTVTAGIVSAVDRAMQTTNGAEDMVQTDAPINPGNSGGPLADLSGRVIGINDQIESESGSSSGVGFAIPIDTAKAVADKIVAGEPVTFAFLGVQSQDSGQGIVGNGALIISVENGSPAAKAGIQQGDIITRIGSTEIDSSTTLSATIRDAHTGETETVVLRRNGKTHTVSVTLGSTSST